MNLSENAVIKKEQLYEQIADSIEKSILSRPEIVGTMLPSEQNIANQFNVSRNVIRESFKILKERGFIDIRNGSRSYIRKPGAKNVKVVMNRFIKTEQTDISDVFEVRYALELSAVRLAAEKSEKNLEKCERAIALMQKNINNRALWAKYDYEFHMSIVENTGNSLFLALYDSVSVQLKELFEAAWGNCEVMKTGMRFHKEILQAIRKGDGDGAVKLMQSHLDDSKVQMENYLLNKGDE